MPTVLIAKQLAKLGVVNIGAVGTFVVREDVGESALRAALVRNLPFKCEIMICPAKEILAVESIKGSILTTTLGPGHSPVRECVSQTASWM